jgi:hypothetical protein
MSPGPLVGLGLAVALRRWPGVALALSAAGAWAAHLAWGGQWSHRGVVVGVALLLALSPLRDRWAGRALAALVVGAASWVSDLPTALLGAGVVALATLSPAALLDRAEGEGPWVVCGIAGLCGAVLLAFTGSVRLAEECALITVPMFGLAGRPQPPAAVSTVALLLGTAVAMGVVRSELGIWAVVPGIVLCASCLGNRGRLQAGLAAAGLAVLGTAPVIIDWLRDPPF